MALYNKKMVDMVAVLTVLMYLFSGVTHAHSGLPNRLTLSEAFYESRGSIYSDDLNEAGKFLKKFDLKADELMHKDGLANWAYETDLSDKHLQEKVEVGLEVSEFFLASSENASQIKTLDLPPKIHRQISLIRRSGEPTSYAMRREIKETIGKLTSIFGKGKVTKRLKKYTLSDLTSILMKSKNRTELNWAWKSWRDKVGPPMKNSYSNLIDLLNVGAREHGWIDYGDYSRSDYEMGDDFEISLKKVWQQIEPLYKELHAYVRYQIAKRYGIDKNGCLPANLLGDMFAQDWSNIFDMVKPLKTSKTFDVTKELKRQGYNVHRMFKLSESFFVSLGLEKMPESFWEKSVFVKPKNKEMVCHASAWDVSNTDVRYKAYPVKTVLHLIGSFVPRNQSITRIKMCTKVNQEYLTTVHHEMGHVEYFLAYKKQPNTLRAGANPGFHEAIGDTISLSVETPSYLNQIGLLKSATLGKDDTISFLLNQALRRVAPIPYNYLVDKWRWRVYEGNITENCYNKEWWKMRVKYQGVEPPVSRPANAFDAASKYHISANVPYVAYFVSYVLQFQLHKAFCKVSGYKGPLHTCSIYKSKEAGKKLKQMLEAGRSKPWPKILKDAIGEQELKADAILEYFKPLNEWLKQQRNSKRYPLGWKNQMTKQVLQKKTKKYEAGQERSGILKTNSGDVSLSINIPSVTLTELLKKANSSNSNGNGKETAMIDLGKLLDSSKLASVQSAESPVGNNDHKTSNPIKTNANDDDNKSSNKPIGNAMKATNERKPAQLELVPLESLLPSGYGTNKSVESTTNKETPAKESAPGMHNEDVSPSRTDAEQIKQHPPVPLAVNARPLADFPSTVVSPKEAKHNPQSAGIAKEQHNPIAASVPQAVKSNPVPPNQVALIPVSLPSNVLSALKTALNGTNSLDLGTLQHITNNTNEEAGKSHSNQSVNAQGESLGVAENQLQNKTTEYTSSDHKNTTGLLHAAEEEKLSEANSTTNLHSPVSNGSRLVSEDSVSSDPPNPLADSQIIDGNNQTEAGSNASSLLPLQNVTSYPFNLPLPQQGSSDFVSTQSVSPCKRNDGQCLFGKVTTEGNSLPTASKNDLDNSKQTVSVSPSLLIQKLIEKHVAEKSTPDPVVNSPNINASETTSRSDGVKDTSDESDTNKNSNTMMDVGKLISALTGATNTTNDKNGSPDNENGKQTNEVPSINNSTSPNTENNYLNILKSIAATNAVSNETFPSNCSGLKKRGISLNYNCERNAEKNGDQKKSGSLSISPSELLQKLLESKTMKNEVNRKTIPSAHVEKTPNGFQLNFDLNPKDKIPVERMNKNPIEHQQHVDVFNTPKGMVVKPKSSVQLLTPQFVPIQNKDNMELRNNDG